MFKLLFYPYGAIGRGKFLLGLFDIVMLFFVVGGILVVLGGFAFKAIDPKDFAAAYMKSIRTNVQEQDHNTSTNSTITAVSEVHVQTATISNANKAETADAKNIDKKMSWLVIGVYGSLLLLSLWCKFCLYVKRLADLNVSRWLVVLPYSTMVIMYFTSSENIPLYCISFWALFNCVMLLWPSRLKA
jgi:uncharacterized membrane protein YhaH (DUF805 family)